MNLLDTRARHATSAFSGERVRTCLLTAGFSMEGTRDGNVGRARSCGEWTVPDNFRDRQSPAVAARRSTVRQNLADGRGSFTAAQILRHRPTSADFARWFQAGTTARTMRTLDGGGKFPPPSVPGKTVIGVADGGVNLAPPSPTAATADARTDGGSYFDPPSRRCR